MTDRADAIIVRRDPVRGPPERDRYEPRSDGRWRRVDEVWTGCAWRPRGSAIIEAVAVEGGRKR